MSDNPKVWLVIRQSTSTEARANIFDSYDMASSYARGRALSAPGARYTVFKAVISWCAPVYELQDERPT
jgi:hypothetical protein